MGRIQESDVNNKSSVVALAIKGNKKSKYVVQWALNKFVPEGMIFFKFIHVHAVGNVLPVSQMRNDVAAACKKEVEWQTNQMLLPFKKMCEQRKVHVDVVVIESDDVATAVAEEVAKDATTKLVVGASSGGIFKSIPHRYNSFWKELEYAKSLMKNRQDLNLIRECWHWCFVWT